MNLFTKQKKTHRCRKQTYGHLYDQREQWRRDKLGQDSRQLRSDHDTELWFQAQRCSPPQGNSPLSPFFADIHVARASTAGTDSLLAPQQQVNKWWSRL